MCGTSERAVGAVPEKGRAVIRKYLSFFISRFSLLFDPPLHPHTDAPLVTLSSKIATAAALLVTPSALRPHGALALSPVAGARALRAT